MVIKNGCYHFPQRKIYKKGDPIKLIYHSTPWRGLSVILGAMQYVKNPPTVVTGVCNLWRNNVSFPAGKLSQWNK